MFRRIHHLVPLVPFAALACVACIGSADARSTAAAPANLLLLHGVVVTEDPARPSGQAIAISGDTILAVGTDATIQEYAGPNTRVIDLHGATVVPGFNESHGHFMSLGESKMELDLTTARNWDEIVQMVAAAVKTAKPGAWIQGRGWHQEKWDKPPQPNIEGLPLGTDLAAVSPNNPVILEHASGHAVFVNRKALELAGVGPSTPNPQGGEIVRDTHGQAIGMLRDRAMDLVQSVLAKSQAGRTPDEVRAHDVRAVELAAQDALSKGITTFQDQGESFPTLEFLKDLAAQNKLPIRLYEMVGATSPQALESQLAAMKTLDFDHDHFTVRTIGEVTTDGALGTHSAWFLKPYTDLPTSSGFPVVTPEQLHAIAELAVKYGYQVTAHAIGDRANEETLNVFEAVFKKHPELRDPRWRIEHAQHLAPADIPRFGQLHVIASMQSIHACSDGPYVVKRLGEQRAKDGAYAWRSLLATRAVIANGTDVPVENEDPIPNFHCAVTRQLADGSLFFPNQKMTRAEALRSYTLSAAYAMFAEHRLGSLAPGKLADITVLDRDIMTVPDSQILGTKVLYTIVGGTVAYQRASK